jgi:transposase
VRLKNFFFLTTKDHLDCCFGQSDSSQNHKFGKSKRFKNSKLGFLELLKWTKQQQGSGELFFVFTITKLMFLFKDFEKTIPI